MELQRDSSSESVLLAKRISCHEQSKPNSSQRSLTHHGTRLSTTATMTCLVLVCCRCDRVPALLFARASQRQRRWDVSGEVEILERPAAEKVPQWVEDVFVVVERKFGDVKSKREDEGVYYPTTLGIAGLPRSSASFHLYQLSDHVKSLCKDGIISAELDQDDYLYLQMNQETKEDVLHQTTDEDHIYILFGLLKLVINTFPDAYAEAFWSRIAAQCRPVIESTVLPFLSVIEWSHLHSNRAMYVLKPP